MTGSILYLFLFASSYAYDYPCGYLQRPYGTIRGGNVADSGAWPWIASIRLKDNAGREHVCAGTLVGRKYIITAGHCMYMRQNGQSSSTSIKASDLLVVTGTQMLDAPYANAKESVSSVKKIHFHPKYRSKDVRPWAYDLAVLELDTAPKHEDVSRPACLPVDNVPPSDGETCLIAGWGKTENARFSRALMQAEVPIVSRSQCNSQRNWNDYIDDTMLCALSKSRASACQGDSGGPLICERHGQYYLYGVVSWGPIICGDKPGVFTNLAKTTDWLQSILEEAGEDIDPGSKSNIIDKTKFNENLFSNPVQPPCDAALFERKHGWVLFGPAPMHYELNNVSIRECMSACCARGQSDCMSFIYYHKERKCNLRKVTRCDNNVFFQERTDGMRQYAGAVTYYGKKEC